MFSCSGYRDLLLLLTVGVLATSCASAPPPTAGPRVVEVQHSQVVEVKALASPKHGQRVPPGSRIVIADIAGPCADEVKDALMRRLIDNSNYEVLTRDNLEQIIDEADMGWAGRFNTETATKLGELMSASYFVVGRVAYCGQSATDAPDAKGKAQLHVIAVLQILDLETGKVLVSSASEGHYIPRRTALVRFAADQVKAAESAARQLSRSTPNLFGGLGQMAMRGLNNVTTSARNALTSTSRGNDASAGGEASGEKSNRDPEPRDYAVIRAADDMANGFADRFFARPTWETLEMWWNKRRRYADSIRYVQLGHCPTAVKLLETQAAEELPKLDEFEVGEYLHNYGVALLCADRVEEATRKLQSAYRIGYNQTTLKMLGLASKVAEWDLTIEIDREPEVHQILFGKR